MMMISSTQCYKLQTIWSAEYEKFSTSIIKKFHSQEKRKKKERGRKGENNLKNYLLPEDKS